MKHLSLPRKQNRHGKLLQYWLGYSRSKLVWTYYASILHVCILTLFKIPSCPRYLKRRSLEKLRIIIRPGCYWFFPIKENVNKWHSWLNASISDITLTTQTPVVSRATSASTNKEFVSAIFRPWIFCWADLLCFFGLVDFLCSWSNWRAIFVAVKTFTKII